MIKCKCKCEYKKKGEIVISDNGKVACSNLIVNPYLNREWWKCEVTENICGMNLWKSNYIPNLM